jgi:hypothetical protein
VHMSLRPLTFGITPIPSPIKMGPTVTITLSTNTEPSDRKAVFDSRKNAERIREPPSIITDLRLRDDRILGSDEGGTRPSVRYGSVRQGKADKILKRKADDNKVKV